MSGGYTGIRGAKDEDGLLGGILGFGSHCVLTVCVGDCEGKISEWNSVKIFFCFFTGQLLLQLDCFSGAIGDGEEKEGMEKKNGGRVVWGSGIDQLKRGATVTVNANNSLLTARQRHVDATETCGDAKLPQATVGRSAALKWTQFQKTCREPWLAED